MPVAEARYRLVRGVPVVRWADFWPALRWQQGEHVSMIGPTGTGKTTLLLRLAERRRYVTVLGCKPKDDTLDPLKGQGWQRVKRWPPPYPPRDGAKVLLWPDWSQRLAECRQHGPMLADAIEDMFLAGGWCIGADELAFLCDDLKLAPVLKRVWNQGRSMGVSLLGATQRPSWVPRQMYSAATHVFLWRTRDDEDLRTIKGLGSMDSRLIRSVVRELPRHAFLYCNTRDDVLVISRVG